VLNDEVERERDLIDSVDSDVPRKRELRGVYIHKSAKRRVCKNQTEMERTELSEEKGTDGRKEKIGETRKPKIDNQRAPAGAVLHVISVSNRKGPTTVYTAQENRRKAPP
jgi:hypothetical protein